MFHAKKKRKKNDPSTNKILSNIKICIDMHADERLSHDLWWADDARKEHREEDPVVMQADAVEKTGVLVGPVFVFIYW